MLRILLAALAAVYAVPALAEPFAPVPRWPEEPETEAKCAAVRAECPALAGREIEVEAGYDELCDADCMLVGLRLTRSTGCEPLDEAMLLGHRHFRLVFHKPGVPDLDNIRAETGPGADRAAVRIVKAGQTSLSLGCG